MSVSRASPHAREATALVKFLRRRDAERARDAARLESPRRLELFELPTALRPFSLVAESPRPGARAAARPSVIAGRHYEDVTRAYFREVRSVLTGNKLPATAADALERELVAITGFRPGPPVVDR